MRLLLVLLAGCHVAGECDAPADTAAAFVCASDFGLQIGTGESAFEPLGDGFVLHKGSQGLQHIVVSLSADVAPEALPIDRALVRLVPRRGDGAELPTLEVGYALTPTGDHVEARGVLLVFDDPALVVDQDITLSASLEPVGFDGVGHASAAGVVSWEPTVP